MLRTFRLGGIHPQENKLSAGQRISHLPLPKEVVIPLGMHIGAPAVACVQKGDEVKVGTIIAKVNGPVSAHIHSSVSGKVVKIDTVYDASGYKKPAIVIAVNPEDIWEEYIDRSDDVIKECSLSPSEIVSKIHSAGIVGLGGATFPTHVKLTPPPGHKAEVLIVNAVECEPYLTSDHQLMLEHGEEILIGCSILMKALGVSRCLIGIENNKPDAISLLKELSQGYSGVEIIPLKVHYPQGGEKQLIDALLRRQVKSGALPISTGAVVQNVGTVFAVYEAVQKHKPLIERIVTVTGKSLTKPANYKVRIGTPLKHLIDASGGLPEDTGKIIGGGPMMGKALLSQEQPVTKGTSGILLIDTAESVRKPTRPCIRCAKCVNVCPMGLNPTFLMTDVQYQDYDKAERGYIVDCIECGSCSYTCPSNRPLLDYIRMGKQQVMGIIRNRKS